jgi:hypothetical protein
LGRCRLLALVFVNASISYLPVKAKMGLKGPEKLEGG